MRIPPPRFFLFVHLPVLSLTKTGRSWACSRWTKMTMTSSCGDWAWTAVQEICLRFSSPRRRIPQFSLPFLLILFRVIFRAPSIYVRGMRLYAISLLSSILERMKCVDMPEASGSAMIELFSKYRVLTSPCFTVRFSWRTYLKKNV